MRPRRACAFDGPTSSPLLPSCSPLDVTPPVLCFHLLFFRFIPLNARRRRRRRLRSRTPLSWDVGATCRCDLLSVSKVPRTSAVPRAARALSVGSCSAGWATAPTLSGRAGGPTALCSCHDFPLYSLVLHCLCSAYKTGDRPPSSSPCNCHAFPPHSLALHCLASALHRHVHAFLMHSLAFHRVFAGVSLPFPLPCPDTTPPPRGGQVGLSALVPRRMGEGAAPGLGGGCGADGQCRSCRSAAPTSRFSSRFNRNLERAPA